MNTHAILSSRSLVLVFAYTPAGLGHLRVTDALYHGLPEEASATLLGSQDKSIRVIHRILSIHPLIRSLMEWTQKGVPENIFTFLYRGYLRSNAQPLYKQLITILDQRIELPETILVIATHFGLAHQLSVIKEKLAAEKGVRVVLVVQVTDDSPQKIWYIPGSDIIFVPSTTTRNALERYGIASSLKAVKFEVIPYPISPLLSKTICQECFRKKIQQVEANSHATVHMAIPISGAAVGTEYFRVLIDELHLFEKRFMFHVVSKSAPYTFSFLSQMLEKGYVDLRVSAHDRGIVDLYEQLYKETNISLEVTKPSEQAFKALLTPKQRGGSLLLFSQPVGRQEYDNLDFLRRHHILPTRFETSLLWRLSLDEKTHVEELNQIKKIASSWRGLELPSDPKHASRSILWCLRNNIFAGMMEYTYPSTHKYSHAHEINSSGVRSFWYRVAQFLSTPS